MSSVNGQTTSDPTYGGLFTTPKPYVDPDEYVQPENKQDQFDWKLTKVSDDIFWTLTSSQTHCAFIKQTTLIL